MLKQFLLSERALVLIIDTLILWWIFSFLVGPVASVVACIVIWINLWLADWKWKPAVPVYSKQMHYVNVGRTFL